MSNAARNNYPLEAIADEIRADTDRVWNMAACDYEACELMRPIVEQAVRFGAPTWSATIRYKQRVDELIAAAAAAEYEERWLDRARQFVSDIAGFDL